MLLRNELEALHNIDIKNIHNHDLQELSDIVINPDIPVEERLTMFFKQIKNPYCFMVNGYPVQISYANHNKTLEHSLYEYLTDKLKSNETI